MPRYIDADATQDRAFQLNFDFRITERELAIINRLLLEAPTADVVERKKGRWITEPNCWYRCSHCGDHYPSFKGVMEYNYCPTCGFDMREEQTDDH